MCSQEVMPPAHPFDPIKVLRLALVLDCDRKAIATIFRFIWQDGGDVSEPGGWTELISRLAVQDVEAQITQPRVKERLRRNTEEAIRRGVFGVPTAVVSTPRGDDLFWGVESLDMLSDYVADTELFDRGEMARIADLPVGARRRL